MSAIFFRQSEQSSVYYKSPARGRFISHPWYTTVAKSDDGWDIVIKPGFVNGIAPIVAQKFLEKRVVNGVLKVVEVERDISLLNRPPIKISAESKNFYRTPIPLPFFADMGASNPGSDTVAVGETGVQIKVDSSGGSGREDKSYMLQCVVYLSTARATQKLQTQVSGNPLTGSIVDYVVSYDTQALQSSGQLPRIKLAGTMPEPPPQTGLRNFEDSGFDNIEIATIYFVSPKGFAESQEPGASSQDKGFVPSSDWDIYVKHNLFWNLFYQMKTDVPVNIPGSALDLATASFVGRYTVAAGAAAAAQNALLSEALAAAFNVSNQGKYWTA